MKEARLRSSRFRSNLISRAIWEKLRIALSSILVQFRSRNISVNRLR